ncbi:MAG: hypothetical protein ABH814_03720 [bacterium]
MATEILLILIIFLLTFNLLFVGVYIVLVLKDVRVSLQKLNKVLDEAHEVTSAVKKPIKDISNLAEGVSAGLKALPLVSSLLK